MRPERRPAGPAPARPPLTAEQKRANQRLGLILGAIALAIFVGFIVKSALFGVG